MYCNTPSKYHIKGIKFNMKPATPLQTRYILVMHSNNNLISDIPTIISEIRHINKYIIVPL